jgi:hypothetical protein
MMLMTTVAGIPPFHSGATHAERRRSPGRGSRCSLRPGERRRSAALSSSCLEQQNRAVEWDLKVILRPFYIPKWRVSTPEPDETNLANISWLIVAFDPDGEVFWVEASRLSS